MRTLELGSMTMAAGALAALLSAAPLSSARAGELRWYHHFHHHHCCYHHHAVAVDPYFTQYVHAGYVAYPVYRVDHYKIDYAAPTYVYDGGSWGW
jgi:hypothetical protein